MLNGLGERFSGCSSIVKIQKMDLRLQLVLVRKFFAKGFSKLSFQILISAGIMIPLAAMLATFLVFGIALDFWQWSILGGIFFLAGIFSVAIWWIARDAVPECGACSLQDLNTALEQARKISEKGSQHLRDVLNSMQTFIGVLSPDGIVLEVNETALSVAGESMKGVAGKKFEDTKWWAYSEASKQQIREIIKRGKAGERYNGELKYQTGTGELRSVDFLMTPLFGKDGKVEFLIPSGVDIEARKSFEDQLIKSRMDAEIANQAKSAFLAHMSHELRSPLGIILGFTDFALEEDNPQEKNDHLQTIRRNALQLLALVDEVLDLGKIESGRVSLDISDVRLDKLVSELQVALELKSRERGIELKFTFEPGTPTLLRTDPLRLKQILLNLVGNAVKYTEKGIPGSVSQRQMLRGSLSRSRVGARSRKKNTLERALGWPFPRDWQCFWVGMSF
ncbi:MAG: PAS domain S-box protein [Proteobacteria bacterium]|nr:PAS domain S-box protein [Pseudomonadota bacterium]